MLTMISMVRLSCCQGSTHNVNWQNQSICGEMKIIFQLSHSFTCPGIVAWVLEILITLPDSSHKAQNAFWILGYSVLQLVANQSPDICTLLYLEGT